MEGDILTKKKSSSNKSSQLTSVKNAMKILKCFSLAEPERRVSELAKELGLSKSTVSRILSTLASEGFVIKNPKDQSYKLGLTVLTLGGVVTSQLDVHKEATPVLNDVVAKTGETAHLAILDGLDTIYIHKRECSHPVRLLSHVGRRNPAYCTSSGKVLLAFNGEEIVEEVIQNGLKKYAKNTITDPDQLRKELKMIRKQGYATSSEEITEGTRSVAAPIRDWKGKVVSALTVVGPIQRMQDYKIPTIIRVVKEAAKEASERLGYDERYIRKTINI